MNVKLVPEKALILDSKETVNRAIGKMIKNNKNEAMVFDDGKFIGVIFSNDIVKKRINNPEQAKIGKFVEHIKPSQKDISIEDAIKIFLANDYKSIPINKKSNPSFITKRTVLNALKNRNELKTKTAKDIMSSPFCINTDDSIATAISVTREAGVSRLPALNRDGKAEGVIDSLAILKTYAQKNRMKSGEEAGEKTRATKAFASSIMKTDFPRVKPDNPMKYVIGIMIINNADYAIVEDKQNVVGVITPNPILRLFSDKKRSAHVKVIGIDDENDFIRSVIDDEINNALRKFNRMLAINYLVIHIDKYHRKGRKKECVIKSRLITKNKMLFASSHAWDVTKAVRETLNKLEREVKRKKEKKKTYSRAP